MSSKVIKDDQVRTSIAPTFSEQTFTDTCMRYSVHKTVLFRRLHYLSIVFRRRKSTTRNKKAQKNPNKTKLGKFTKSGYNSNSSPSYRIGRDISKNTK